MQPKPRVQYLSAVKLAVRPPARHGEPYLALLRTPIGEILVSRLPEYPEDVGSTRLRATVALRASCGFFDKNGRGWTMSGTMGRLLAAGQRAEVFEWALAW
jgi:hypothetical protein